MGCTETRVMQAVSDVIVKGAVVVAFQATQEVSMVVSGEDEDTIRGIKTQFVGDKLIIEQEGFAITGGSGATISVSGSGNIVISGNGGRFSLRGGSFQSNFVSTPAVVSIGLPEAPNFRIDGSGDVNINGINQEMLSVEINGSGDISAEGQVSHLKASVAGSGDVDASSLKASTATLLVAGSGDINAHVSEAVNAQVKGSGDIVVRGNPASRIESVMGSGDVKFK